MYTTSPTNPFPASNTIQKLKVSIALIEFSRAGESKSNTDLQFQMKPLLSTPLLPPLQKSKQFFKAIETNCGLLSCLSFYFQLSSTEVHTKTLPLTAISGPTQSSTCSLLRSFSPPPSPSVILNRHRKYC